MTCAQSDVATQPLTGALLREMFDAMMREPIYRNQPPTCVVSPEAAERVADGEPCPSCGVAHIAQSDGRVAFIDFDGIVRYYPDDES